MLLRTLLGALLLASACQTGGDAPPQPCELPRQPERAAPEATLQLPLWYLEHTATVNQPNADGAMGRNLQQYIHPRFQMGVSPLAEYGVAAQDPGGADAALRGMQYSLDRQLPAGDFEFVPPPGIPGTATATDLASGTAFYMGASGWASLLLQRSAWFANLPQSAQLPTQIAAYAATADWLIGQVDLLRAADAAAPNRLLYDALAFYTWGEVLDRDDLRAIGADFVQRALVQQHPEGYFIEGGGYDSSYQGVTLALGLRTYLLLPSGSLRDSLWTALARGMCWQQSRILPSGEISTEGNTRVYPGGEEFLGEEKGVAVAVTVEAFLLTGVLSGEARWTALAERIRDYYQ